MVPSTNVITDSHFVSISFHELSSLWFSIISNQKAQTTVAKYRQILDCYLLPHFGHIPVQTIDTLALSDYFSSMLEAPFSLSRQTVHLIKTVCNEIFHLADALALVRYNPCIGVYIPKRHYDPSEILSREIIDALINKKCPGIYENLFPLMLVSAMRFGEAAALSDHDIDVAHNTIHIQKQLVSFYQDGHMRHELHPATKNHLCRTIQLPPFAMQYLDAERKKRDANQLLARENWSNPQDLLFTNANGEYLSHCKVYRKFKQIVTKLGQPNATLQTLRHTGATFAYYSWENLQKVRSLTGHSSDGAAAYYIHSLNSLSERGGPIWIS